MSGVKERLVITNPQVALEPDHLDGHAPRSSPSVSTHVRTKGSPSSAPRREDRLRKITREMIIEAISTPTDAERLCVSDATMYVTIRIPTPYTALNAA